MLHQQRVASLQQQAKRSQQAFKQERLQSTSTEAKSTAYRFK